VLPRPLDLRLYLQSKRLNTWRGSAAAQDFYSQHSQNIDSRVAYEGSRTVICCGYKYTRLPLSLARLQQQQRHNVNNRLLLQKQLINSTPILVLVLVGLMAAFTAKTSLMKLTEWMTRPFWWWWHSLAAYMQHADVHCPSSVSREEVGARMIMAAVT